MADLIKKVKIKKSDGTYTDFIPIGAEAVDVETHKGESVENRLNKTPYYYNNIEDMRKDNYLQIGDMAITLGYHNANDKGAGTYKIVGGIHQEDGGSYHKLENGLYAELILIDDYVTPNLFGAYGDLIHDDGVALQKAIDFILAKNSDDPGYCPHLSGGNYYITRQIVINTPSQFTEWKINLKSIKGKYAGYLIDLKGPIGSCSLTIGSITNQTGGCIRCISDTAGNTWMGTTQINCNFMTAAKPYDCIHLEADTSTLASWINDNEINVKRFSNGRYGLYAKGCHQLIMNHCDFEYGACYLDSCNGAVFFAPHMSDVVSTTYTIETVGNCGSLLIVGGSNAMLSYEDRADRKFKFSEGTNGGIVSFQGVYNTVAAVINKSPFCNIIGGKIIRVQPYFYNLNLGAGTFDTRTLTSLQCPTFMVTTNDTRTIILDKKIYGGMGKINEFTVQTNNTTLDIYIADGTTTKLLYSFSNSMYKKYKFKWYREPYWWFVEEDNSTQINAQ